MLDKSDPVHKVTIIPRGMALGITWSLPEDDRHQMTREELLAQITMALGGRLAEEIQFGDVTTGASNDFEKATELARRMVTQYGMSELGPIQFGRGAHQVFLGRDFGEERNYSEEVASKIDGEVRRSSSRATRAVARSSQKTGTRSSAWSRRCSNTKRSTPKKCARFSNGKPYDRTTNRAEARSRPIRSPNVAPAEEPQREKPVAIPPTIRPEPA